MIYDHEHGVVTAYGANHMLEAESVDGLTGCAGASRKSLDYDQILSAGI